MESPLIAPLIGGRQGESAGCRGGGKREQGVSSSINQQARAGVKGPGVRSRAGAGCVWSTMRNLECLPTQSLLPGSLGVLERVLGGDAGPAGQRRREVTLLWNLLWKTGEAGSVHSSSLPQASPVHPSHLPTLSRCSQGPKEIRCTAGSSSFPDAGQEVPLLLFLGQAGWCAELLGRWEPANREGWRGWEGTGERQADDMHTHWMEAQGSHRFWQHCSLLGFCHTDVH